MSAYMEILSDKDVWSTHGKCVLCRSKDPASHMLWFMNVRACLEDGYSENIFRCMSCTAFLPSSCPLICLTGLLTDPGPWAFVCFHCSTTVLVIFQPCMLSWWRLFSVLLHSAKVEFQNGGVILHVIVFAPGPNEDHLYCDTGVDLLYCVLEVWRSSRSSFANLPVRLTCCTVRQRTLRV